MMNEVVLVDERDRAIGTMDKLIAHKTGALHRAVSLFVFNSAGELLLQQRAQNKYHSGELWANACCTHPYPWEVPHEAIERRALEEMGLRCKAEFACTVLYKAEVGADLIEHELDHVFTAVCDTQPLPSASEVMDYKFMSMQEIENDLAEQPEIFAAWFPILFERIKQFVPCSI